MNNDLDKDLQEAINDESSSQELSSNFTFKVMDKVEHLSIGEEREKKPLVNWISGSIFVFFGILMIVPLIWGEWEQVSISFEEINFEAHSKTVMIISLVVITVALFIFADTLFRRRKKEA